MITGLWWIHLAVAGFVSMVSYSALEGMKGGASVSESVPSPAIEKKQLEDFLVKLTPEMRQSFEKILAAMADKKRKWWSRQMERVTKEMAKFPGADAKLTEALNQAAAQAIEESLTRWQSAYAQTIRQGLPEEPKQLRSMLQRQLSVIGRMDPERDTITGITEPEQQPVWTEALKTLLSPEQAVAWAELQNRHKQEEEKSVQAALTAMEGPMRQQQEATMRTRVLEMQKALQLAPDRTAELEEMSRAAVAKYLEAWRQGTEPMIRGLSVINRQSVLQGRSSYSSVPAGEEPENQPVWKEGIAGLLTDEEQKRLQTARAEHQERRRQTMGAMLLMEIDREVALNSTQRAQLQATAVRLVQEETSFFPADGRREDYVTFNRQTFFRCAAKATVEDLRTLDEEQRKHWQQVTAASLQERPQGFRPASEKAGAEPELEPEVLENAIADFLQQKIDSQRGHSLNRYLLQVEEISRLLQLPAERLERLRTAARGAAEATALRRRQDDDSNVRATLANATPRDIRQRLANVEEYNFAMRENTATEGEGIWTETVGSELSAEQQTIWKKEQEERKAFRNGAITALILTELDRKINLSTDQQEKLRPALGKNLTDAEEGFNMFSFSDGDAWYSQRYSLFMPLAGVPEGDLKAILSKEQLDGWTGSSEHSMATSYWQNVERNRTARKGAR